VASVLQIAGIRDQTVAVISIDFATIAALMPDERVTAIEIDVVPTAPHGSVARNVGPFTNVCARTILNYTLPSDAAPAWRPMPGTRESGTVTFCSSVAECEQSEIDFLFLVADEFHSAAAVYLLATHRAAYLGLNVGIVSMSAVGETSAENIHDFIQTVFETQSAAHFGDGHLGFVLLIGDAYADDNETLMIPAYDGYGGQQVASDHYYSCVSGDDDFEDVMLGRLSVGNTDELTAVVNKARNYMPLPSGAPWRDQTVLIGGLFYNEKDDYVALFDEYEEIIPTDHAVDRIYRHDFDSDFDCAMTVADAFNEGYLFLNFAGDGWISEWYHTFRTTHLSALSNADRLPIVLSMACLTGWLDNTAEPDILGSYDCLAEQLVNLPDAGAIACLAAPRYSDGGSFRTLTKKIYEAAFNQNSLFLGETFAVAKLLHLQSGGDVSYVRHFNLFGDPSLIYKWDEAPGDLTDLTAKPYQATWLPENLTAGDDLSVAIVVTNQSVVQASSVVVRLSDDSSTGSYVYDETIPLIDSWSSVEIEIIVPAVAAGAHTIEMAVDPNDEIAEIDEGNNSFTTILYAYPVLPGFPADIDSRLIGATVVPAESATPAIAVLDEQGRVSSVRPDGNISWTSGASLGPLDFGIESPPAAADLDGDGANEIISTRRMGLKCFSFDGEVLWDINTDDPIGSPLIADADADTDLDIVVAMKGLWGAPSTLSAFDEDGAVIWMHEIGPGIHIESQLAAGDMDMDGRVDFVFVSSIGDLTAMTNIDGESFDLWQPVHIDASLPTVLAIGDVDDDGLLEILCGGSELYCISSESGSVAWSLPLGDDVVSLALADMDADGIPEILAGTASGTLHMIDAGVPVWSTPLSDAIGSSAVVADVYGDENLEVVIGSASGYVHVLDASGDEVFAPIPIPGGCATPTAIDLDEDGSLELTVTSLDGRVYAFSFASEPPEEDRAAAPEWNGIGGTPGHRGIYAQPLNGDITSDLLLTGRCVLAGDVTVTPEATLVIAPGTAITVKSAEPPTIRIDGALTAVGTAENRIAFSATQGSRQQSWVGLDFGAGTSSSLAHCTITDADVALAGSHANLIVSDCLLDGNGFGAYLDTCTVAITRSGFSACDSLGAHFSDGSGTVIDCSFDQNYLAGVKLTASASHAFSGCSFSETNSGSGVDLSKFVTASFDSCGISGNATHGVCINNSSPEFTGCTIADNGADGVDCRKTASPRFTGNTITGNRTGVCSNTGSHPNLGDDMYPDTGYNIIAGNQMAAVANYGGPENPIYARRNWWGSAPPSGRIFIGHVLYEPFLTAPPEADLKLEGDEMLPSIFGLSQNSPNPFNPITTLSYDVPSQGGKVEITIYNTLGRRVAALVSGHHDAGTYLITWNGRDQANQKLASGIYFARMVAPGFASTTKMILLK
jgi:outer membrane protein assembly factor BamB